MTTTDDWSIKESLLLAAVDLTNEARMLGIKSDGEWSLLGRMFAGGVTMIRMENLVDRIRLLGIKAANDQDNPVDSKAIQEAGTNIALRLESLRRTLNFKKDNRAEAVVTLTQIHDDLVEYARLVGEKAQGDA